MHTNFSGRSVKIKTQLILETKRLYLRAFKFEDAPEIQRLAGTTDISGTTEYIPFPYPDGYALNWIRNAHYSFNQSLQTFYAITLKPEGKLIGSIGLDFHHSQRSASMGYWMGVPYWGKGYTTEAAKRVLQFGFEILKLHRIQAKHMLRNPASGKILQKIGMLYEGTARESRYIRGVFETLQSYAILKSDYCTLHGIKVP
jgi:ribosomal-protein-alanine N-acetyltransferase